jgi:hypothetical protein
VRNSTVYDRGLIQAVNARAKVYRVLCYLMHFYGPCVATKIVANAVQSCHEEAVRLNTRA